MITLSNQPHEEAERRQSMLFADVLAVMNRFAGNGSSFVEVVSTTDLALVTRYEHEGKVYKITQTVALNYGTREVS